MNPPGTQSCPNCGGPLPAAMGATVQCGFCGSMVTVGPAPIPQMPMGPPIRVADPVSPDHMRRIMIIVIISVVAPIVLTVVISIIVVLATSCAMCGAVGATGMAVSGADPSGFVAPPWNGATPLLCTGNQHRTYTGVVSSQMVTASGNCHLTLISTTVTAALPVNASGNARVTLQGGRYQGNPIAINASGNATVTVQGAQVVGMVNRSGNATVTGVP